VAKGHEGVDSRCWPAKVPSVSTGREPTSRPVSAAMGTDDVLESVGLKIQAALLARRLA
jgi:hypothetical protein